MALLAGNCRVLAGQRKLRRIAVIEFRPLPNRSGVAGGAIFREARRQMIRLRRLLELVAMAADALHRRSGELVVAMTLLAGCTGVLARECEARARVVPEGHALPGSRRVAHRAFAGKASGKVVRIRC